MVKVLGTDKRISYKELGTSNYLGIDGKIGVRCGSANSAAKLTESDIPKIHALRRDGLSYAAIARRYGVEASNIGRIITGEAWQNAQSGCGKSI